MSAPSNNRPPLVELLYGLTETGSGLVQRFDRCGQILDGQGLLLDETQACPPEAGNVALSCIGKASELQLQLSYLDNIASRIETALGVSSIVESPRPGAVVPMDQPLRGY